MSLDVRYGPGRQCIVSCVTDPTMATYMAGLKRMKRRLVEVGYQGSWRLWAGCYPPGSSSHDESPYGFKVAAIEEARRAGYSKICWLDAEAMPVKPLDRLFGQMLTEYGGVISVSGHDPLGEWCSDAALAILDNHELGRDWYHNGDDKWGAPPMVQAGKVYVVDYDNRADRDPTMPRAEEFMSSWRELLDRGVFNGPAINTGAGPEVEAASRAALGHRSAGFCSADQRVRGHRHDEIAAGYLVWDMDIPSGTVNDWVYGGAWSPEAAAKPDVYFCGAPGDQDPR